MTTHSNHEDLDWPSRCGRVLFVGTQLPTLGGGYTFVENLSTALTALGVEVTHASIRPPSREPRFRTLVVFPRHHLLRGPVVRGHGNAWTRLWALPLVVTKRVDRMRCRRRFRRFLGTFPSDSLIVFADVAAKAEADRAGFHRRPGGPVVVGQHHSSFASLDRMASVRAMMDAHYRDLDALVLLTREDAEGFGRLLGVETTAIPNPVSPSRARKHLPGALAVTLSRYSPEKRLDLLVRCFAAATREPDLRHWRLELYGEGTERERIEAAIAEERVGDRVHLMGITSDVSGALDGAAIHLMASTVEGLPVSILEAAVAGVPTLATVCSPGVAELVTADTGYPVSPGDDAESLTAILRAALRRPDELEIKGAAARAAAVAYHPDRIVRRWADLTRYLLDRRR